MITVRYKSKVYSTGAVRKRYVRATLESQIFAYCEVGDYPCYDLLQGTIDESDVPEEIKRQALKLLNFWPGWVEWPYNPQGRT